MNSWNNSEKEMVNLKLLKCLQGYKDKQFKLLAKSYSK